MSVFEFADYKLFLRTHLASLPQKGRGEIGRMAAHLRVHPTLISQVLRGRKDFTPEQIQMVCSYFGFQALESDYLIQLVHQERAGTSELKKYYAKKCEELKRKSLDVASRIKEHRSLTDLERSVFYSNWIYSAIRLFTSVAEGQSLDAVAKRFALTRTQASEILSFLSAAGLCTEEAGVFKLGSQHTHLDSSSPFLNRHHSNWRLRSLHRSDHLTTEEMMFTSPFSVSTADFLKIREELVEVIRSTSKVIKHSPAEEVACMNIDLFWVKS